MVAVLVPVVILVAVLDGNSVIVMGLVTVVALVAVMLNVWETVLR